VDWGASARCHLARVSVAVCAAALGMCLMGAGPATGQEVRGFALNRFNAASPGSDWFALDSLDLRFHLRPAFRLGFDFAHEPLVLSDGGDSAPLVKRQIFFNMGLAMTFISRLRVGLNMPFAIHQAGQDRQIAGVVYRAPTTGNLGDLRAAADVRLAGEYGTPFTLALGAELFFPTGKREQHTGDERLRVLPRVLAAGDADILAYALALGFHGRGKIDNSRIDGIDVGRELSFGAALGVRPTEAILIGAELFGASALTGGNFLEPRATPVEGLLGIQFALGEMAGERWRIAAGVGAGLSDGIGAPRVRALARLEYFPIIVPDRDGDGILDAEDACPDVPGIRTGDPKTNGCPPVPDRDGDGILDREDACPDVPGIRTADPDTSGCPPPRDRDKDGIVDGEDACPDVPGQKTDDPKTNGCPPPDRDRDSILDADDACPDTPGDKTANPKTNGCPDTDKDGIYDPEDACPTEPGPADPDPAKNGCPVVKVDRGQIRILEQIKFKTGSHVILPESDATLQAVAQVFKDHPEIKRVRVEGHTDNRGGRAYNQRLSRRRAESVVGWLITRGGVDGSRLTSQGFGFDRPIADNMTADGRRDNRRVEFHIVEPPPPP
jgi:OmpA-OmpF porin, OOP family